MYSSIQVASHRVAEAKPPGGYVIAWQGLSEAVAGSAVAYLHVLQDKHALVAMWACAIKLNDIPVVAD